MIHNDFKTTDIVLASALIDNGAKKEDITVNGSQGTFTLSGVSKVDLLDYELDKLLVNPRSFNRILKDLSISTKRIAAMVK